jgi:WXXGXW repeat (2 copies)
MEPVGRTAVIFRCSDQRSEEFDMRSLYAAALTLPAILAFAGAASADQIDSPDARIQLAQATVILAPTAPPPIREELPPQTTTTTTTVEQVWEAGHWAWNGSNWVWSNGQYVARPSTISTTSTWQPGHWLQQPNGWLWVEGHWQ